MTGVQITLLQTQMRDGAPDHDGRVAVTSQRWSVAEPGLHLLDSRLCVSSMPLQDEWVYSFLGTPLPRSQENGVSVVVCVLFSAGMSVPRRKRKNVY